MELTDALGSMGSIGGGISGEAQHALAKLGMGKKFKNTCPKKVLPPIYPQMNSAPQKREIGMRGPADVRRTSGALAP